MLNPVSKLDFNDAQIKHFTPEEFGCKCGECDGSARMDMVFVKLLDEFRAFVEIPFIISSGYRCPLHPIEKRKSAPGPHSTGQAADILLHGEQMWYVKQHLGRFKPSGFMEDRLHFWGIGENQKGPIESRFLHLDICDAAPNRPRPHCWTY